MASASNPNIPTFAFALETKSTKWTCPGFVDG